MNVNRKGRYAAAVKRTVQWSEIERFLVSVCLRDNEPL